MRFTWRGAFRGPGWPLRVLLCLYPLWWALGIGEFTFVLVAIPMAWQLRGRSRIMVPPGFGIWLLFVLWNLLSLVMVSSDAPGTTAGSISGRSISIVINLLELIAITVLLVYVSNLSMSDVPQRRIISWLSVLCVVTVAGGVLAMIAPHFSFASPLELVLPHSIRSNAYALTFVHPVAAQVEGGVLGHSSPRPAAPWGYTNFWGNDLSLLLIWFVLDRQRKWARRELAWTLGILLLATVTVVYSLNRGVWFGIILSIGFLVMRVTGRGDVRAALVLIALIPVVAIGFFLTPLHTVVSARAAHGNSDSVRHFLDNAAVKGSLESPVLGWGGVRKAIGSNQSIAVGPSSNCPSCGGVSIGSTGQLWAVLFDQGLLGTIIYFGFFAASLWGLRRDRSPIGSAARLITLLTIFYTVFYNNMPSAMAITMVSIGMSYRQLLASPAVLTSVAMKAPVRDAAMA